MRADPAGAGTLARFGLPGRTALRAAGWWRVAAQAATVAFWVALCRQIEHPAYSALTLMGGALAGRTLALAQGRSWTRRGTWRIVDAARAGMVAHVFPAAPGGVRATSTDAAHALIDLVEQIARYHAGTQPVRVAVGPSCALVLLVVAIVHWPVAVILALATPIIPINMRIAALATAEAEERQLAEVRALTARFFDRFRGMGTIVTLGAVDRESAVIRAAGDRLNAATMVVLRRAFVVSAVLDAVITCAVAVCATYVGLDLLGYLPHAGPPHLTYLAGLLVLVLAPVYFAPLREYAAGYHLRDEALAATTALDGLGYGAEPDGRRDPGALAVPYTAPPTVVLSNLSFGYVGAPRPILDDVSIAFPAGRLTAVIAPSGEGKTTLLRMIGGLEQPTGGAVRLDVGRDQAVRVEPGSLSWIGQRTVLLPGTLADNLRVADAAATDHALIAAMTAVGLRPMLERMPHGLDTELGERGWGVSTGQARRLALARALLRDAQLWLLDEPTAHLDRATELELLDDLLTASAGRTVIVATHSHELMHRADLVVRLDRGRLRPEAGQPGMSEHRSEERARSEAHGAMSARAKSLQT